MELLALVLINLVFGFVLYYVISIKMNSSFKDYQNSKLKKEIQTLSLEFYKESDNYLALMDSRITSLKNLLQKAESMGIDFKKLESIPDKPVIPNIPLSSNKPIQKELKLAKSDDEQNEESSIGNFFGSIGKGFKSVLGMNEETPKIKFTTTEKPSINLKISGNPFLEKDQIIDETKNDFKKFLAKSNEYQKQNIEDKISIDANTVLKEIPENLTKVEKVVYLLKKGFTHIEISEAIGLAIPEVSLIETIKMEKLKKNL